MSNELANILASNPHLVQTGLDADTLAVAGGATGGKSLRIKGGVFRKYAGSKEVGAIEDRYMNVIVVKMAHKASRIMYDKAFVEGETSEATCWSSDSNAPDKDVENPQSVSCSTCPHSIKGSGNNGTGSKCALKWRIAVVLPNDPAGDVMELVLPSTSVFGEEKDGKRPFRPYVQYLANNNVSAGRIVTRMQFDTSVTYSKVVFSPVSGVPESDLAIIEEQSKSKDAERAISIHMYKEAPKITEVEFLKALDNNPEEISEPVKRGTTNTIAPDKVEEVASTIKKWSKT